MRLEKWKATAHNMFQLPLMLCRHKRGLLIVKMGEGQEREAEAPAGERALREIRLESEERGFDRHPAF